MCVILDVYEVKQKIGNRKNTNIQTKKKHKRKINQNENEKRILSFMLDLTRNKGKILHDRNGSKRNLIRAGIHNYL